jgi:hypothetical protein
MKKSKTSIAQLDYECWRIIYILILKGDKIFFGKLRDLIIDYKFCIAPSSLSRHLGHLVDAEVVIQRHEGSHVSYEINHDKVGAFEPIIRDISSNLGSAVDAVKKEKELFDEADPDAQLDLVLYETKLRSLLELKSELLLRWSLPNSFEKSALRMLPYIPLFRLHETWLIEKAQDDKYREKILEKIGGLIKKMEEKK